MAVFLRLLRQDLRQFLDRGLGVDDAGGVVGAVDDDALGVRREGLVKGGKVDLEVLDVGGDRHQLRPGALHEDLILRKIRRKCNKGIAGAGQGGQGAAQGTCGTGSEIKVVGGVVRTEAAVEIVGQRPTGLPVALGGGVAMELDGVDGVHQFVDGLGHRGRGGDAGVADGEIVHVLRTHFRGSRLGKGKGLADLRAGRAEI